MRLLSLVHHVFTETVYLILGLINLKSLTDYQLALKESASQISSVLGRVMSESAVRPLSTLERLRRLFTNKVVEAEDPASLFYIPVYIRRDGSVLRVGGTARLNNKKDLFVMKDILISYDLEKAYVNLISKVSDVDSVVESTGLVLPEEELIMVNVHDLINISGTDLYRELALTSMARIQHYSSRYPIHISRSMRKHQLCSGLRRDVQRFLAGFSIAKAWSLGPVDWRLDPGILGLEVETAFSLDFHVEKVGSSVSHLDLLLGEGWDVRQVANSAGYRAVLTLELGVDPCIQYIRIQAHAVLCPEELDRAQYREQTMSYLKRAELSSALGVVGGVGHKSCDNTKNEASFVPLGTAKSLTWEEFDNPYEFNLSSEECSPQRLPQPQGNVFNSCEPSTSTAHTKALQDILEKADFNSQNFYYYSPVSRKSCRKRQTRNLQGPPSTSTPEDESGDETVPDHTEDSIIGESNIEQIVPKFEYESSVAPGDESSLVCETPKLNKKISPQLNTAENNQIVGAKESEKLIDQVCDVNNCSGAISSSVADNNNTKIEEDLPENCDNNVIEVSFEQSPEVQPSNVALGVESCMPPNRGKLVLEVHSEDSVKLSSRDGSSVIQPAQNNFVTDDSSKQSRTDEPSRPGGVQSPSNISAAVSDTSLSNLHSPRHIPTCDESVQARVSEYISSIEPETLTLSPTWMNAHQESSILSPGSLQTPTSPCLTRRGFTSPCTNRSRSLNDVSKDSPSGKIEGQSGDATIDRNRLLSDEGNVSVCSSRSRASRTSRASEQLSGLTGRISQGAVSSMYGVGISGQLVTPFPDDWQYNTIPEVIENDDEID